MEHTEINFGGISSVPVLLGKGKNFYEKDVTDFIKELNPDKIFAVVDGYIAKNSSWDPHFLTQIAPTNTFLLPGGEEAKSFKYLGQLAEELFALGCTKKSLVIGIGGGSVINVTGLLAALMYRGIRLAYVPTTFLAQHDVIPSRKTAINMAGRKNVFGTYYSATAVFIDTDFVRALPKIEFFSGLAELVKNALILGGESFTILEKFIETYKNNQTILQDDQWIHNLVLSGINAKKPLLKVDATELKEAMVFEYGHTIGHAIEYAHGMPHGLAVLYGMLFCSFASHRLGLLSEQDYTIHDRMIRDVLTFIGEGAKLINPDRDKIITKALGDNKRGIIACSSDEISCVLLEKIAKPSLYNHQFLSPIPVSLLKEWMDREFQGYFSKSRLPLGAA